LGGGRARPVWPSGPARPRPPPGPAPPPAPPEPLRLGDVSGERPPARYIGDGATLVRLYAGRPVHGVTYELAGARAEELNIFGD
ncbi:hypothetical protein ACFW8Z_26285, partial [Streptomyces sp. NPDC059515]